MVPGGTFIPKRKRKKERSVVVHIKENQPKGGKGIHRIGEEVRRR